jgi:hypothetical protein
MARCSQLSNLEKSFFLKPCCKDATSFDMAHFSKLLLSALALLSSLSFEAI